MESIKAVIALCDSADEELRHVAIETLLTFGKWYSLYMEIYSRHIKSQHAQSLTSQAEAESETTNTGIFF